MTAKRPYNTNTKKRTYTVTEEDHEALRRLGNGNASAGIRDAVKLSTERGETCGHLKSESDHP